MTARTNFLLCLALSAIPFGVGIFGVFQFASLSAAENAEASAVAEVCLLAYRRTVDTAGHVVTYGAIVLLLTLLASCALAIVRSWLETRRLQSLGTTPAESSKWRTVQEFRSRFLPRSQIELFSAPEPMAITVGYFSPRILLSSGLLETLDDQEIEAVLHHEAAHVRRLDPLRAFVTDACRSTLPFVPLIRYAASRFEVKKEVEADAAAIAAIGSPAPLASALAKVIAGMPTVATQGVGLTPTQARIDALLGKPVPLQSNARLLLAALLSLPALAVLSAGVYILAHAPHIVELHVCPL